MKNQIFILFILLSCAINLKAATISGTVLEPNGTPVSGVEVTLSGDISLTTFTDANGMYQFSDIPEGINIIVTPKLDDFCLCGLDEMDEISLDNHVQDVNPFSSPYQYIAADINNDNNITNFDFVQLSLLLDGVITDFTNNFCWRFVDADYAFPNASNPWIEPFPESINLNDISGIVQADFVAVKTGNTDEVDVGDCTIVCTNGLDLSNYFYTPPQQPTLSISPQNFDAFTLNISILKNTNVEIDPSNDINAVFNNQIVNISGASNWFILSQNEEGLIAFVEPLNGAQYLDTIPTDEIIDDEFDDILISFNGNRWKLYLNQDLIFSSVGSEVFNIAGASLRSDIIVKELTWWSYELPLNNNYIQTSEELRTDFNDFGGFTDFEFGVPYADNTNLLLPPSPSPPSTSLLSIGSSVEIRISRVSMEGCFSNIICIEDKFERNNCIDSIGCEMDIIPPICLNEEVIEVVLDENGSGTLNQDDLIPYFSDNCGISEITPSQVFFDCFSIGQQQEAFVVYDINDNSTFCILDVEIIDNSAPNCSELPDSIIIQLDEFGIASINQSILEELITDSCSPVDIVSQFQFNCSEIGVNDVNISALDIYGNSSNCNLFVIVEDNIAPTCNIQDLIIDATDSNGAIVDFPFQAIDNCGTATINYSSPSGVFYECGQYEIIATIIDDNGNESLCDFILEVKDCDGCCQSESGFMTNVNQGFYIEPIAQNTVNCIVQLFPIALTECQFIKQLKWGDGTLTNGYFPPDLEFIHQYTDIGNFEICITVTETKNDDCFLSQICQYHTITPDCAIITSSTEVRLKKEVNIYPNPSNSKIYIATSQSFEYYEIYDIQGKRIAATDYTSSEIDIALLDSGTYMIKLINNNNFIIKRIVKID